MCERSDGRVMSDSELNQYNLLNNNSIYGEYLDNNSNIILQEHNELNLFSLSSQLEPMDTNDHTYNTIRNNSAIRTVDQVESHKEVI